MVSNAHFVKIFHNKNGNFNFNFNLNFNYNFNLNYNFSFDYKLISHNNLKAVFRFLPSPSEKLAIFRAMLGKKLIN